MIKFTFSWGKYFTAATTWTFSVEELFDCSTVLTFSFFAETLSGSGW
jgi:hypothetical protein